MPKSRKRQASSVVGSEQPADSSLDPAPAPDSGGSPKSADNEKTPSPPARPTVLLVDDEPITRASLGGRLKRLGYEILEAENGRQGVATARLYHPDLIIVDWMMPEMDGPSLCEEVRADPDLKATQLILMTSNDQPDQIAEGLARGADDFLSKSASSQEVLARVHAGLRTHSLVKELEKARDDLDQSYRLLHLKQQELESELRSAGRFVASLLPPPGEPVPGFELAWRYLPSLDLGGDLFNVIPWGAEDLGLYILDASGHGVSAALRAASLMTFLRADSLLRQVGSYDPGAIVTEVNRRFPISADGDYFTLWVGCLHLSTRELRFCTAGHAGALLLNAEAGARELSSPAFPIGFRPNVTYTSESVAVAAGDRLFLFSDGLYEAFSQTGECWGEERLRAAVQDGLRLPLAQSIDSTILQAREWQGTEQFRDDAALVGVQIG